MSDARPTMDRTCAGPTTDANPFSHSIAALLNFRYLHRSACKSMSSQQTMPGLKRDTGTGLSVFVSPMRFGSGSRQTHHP